MSDSVAAVCVPDARAAALDFLRHYVHRGDSEKALRDGHMGHYGGDYRASVGGWAETPKGRKWLPPSKVLV
jgi:hypothetical protein